MKNKDLSNPEEIIESIVFEIGRIDEKSLTMFRKMNYPIRCGSCGTVQDEENRLELIQITAVVFLNYRDEEGQKQLPCPWKIHYCKNCLASMFEKKKDETEVMFQ